MRDLFKILLVGIALFVAPYVFAEPHKVLVLPDNIVTENEAIDSYIYNAASEFFANEVINLLNQTDCIKSPTVSEERALLKSSPSSLIPAKNLTNKFKTSYNVDYTQLRKIAAKSQARYVLLMTTSVDSENYILRRTFWDFCNVPGATVVDPAYKLNTYAVLIDTQSNITLWSNTFYKTISVVENRIITRGPSPQTEQLQKIRDYSRMLCPEIAQNVQKKVLSDSEYAKETKQIYYDMANFDNVFTKKYRRWSQEGKKDYAATKVKIDAGTQATKEKINKTKENLKDKCQQIKEERIEKAKQKQLKVKAEPYVEQSVEKGKVIETKKETSSTVETQSNKVKKIIETNILNINHKTEDLKDESLYPAIDIKKTRKNNLYGEFDSDRPKLRDYN